MIKITDENRVDARELHSALNSKKDFSTWMAQKILDADLVEGTDFSPRKGESTGGRPKMDYSLTLDAAKEICLLQQTAKGKEMRRYLIDQDNKIRDFYFKTDEQFLYMVDVINCLQFITNQKEAFDLHQTHFIAQSIAKNPYAEFAIYRAKITGWTKDRVESAFKEWIVSQHKGSSKLTSMRDKINVMDAPEAIRIAVMDILFASDTDPNLSLKFAAAIKRLADAMNIKAQRDNVDTLFGEKRKVIEIKDVKLIG